MQRALASVTMKLTNLALVAVALLSIPAVTGCAHDDSASKDGDANLDSDSQQLVADDSEAADADDNMENGVDAPLSGADAADPGTPASGASDEEVLEKIRTNAGKHFLGRCLESTRDGNKIHHVFKACRAAWSLKTFEGTVHSTYVRSGNTLTVTHDFDGFLANGATVSGERVITYTWTKAAGSDGVVIEKHRTGNFTGQTKKGKDIKHTADFSASYDSASKCITREGSAETTLGDRTFSRTLTDYKRCGIGAHGCPEAGGKLVLEKTNAAKNKDVSVSIEFEGEDKMLVTKKDGTQVERTLQCNEDAS
jgi:hypothetical protein